MLRAAAESQANHQPNVHPPGYGVFVDTLPYTRLLSSLGHRECLRALDQELGIAWANMAPVSGAFARGEDRVRRFARADAGALLDHAGRAGRGAAGLGSQTVLVS